MTTTEKLNLIRARCVELLAIAEKRTPGKWITDDDENGTPAVRGETGGRFCGTFEIAELQGKYPEQEYNAAYIAACAGAAEAGWRATIAAIDGLVPISAVYCGCDSDIKADVTINAIITAWEGVL